MPKAPTVLERALQRLARAITDLKSDLDALGHADTLDLDPQRTREWSVLEREAQIALARRLEYKPLWCQFCHGPLDYIDGHEVCIHARLGRCPPPNKEPKR